MKMAKNIYIKKKISKPMIKHNIRLQINKRYYFLGLIMRIKNMLNFLSYIRKEYWKRKF